MTHTTSRRPHQIIVAASAHGTSAEHALLMPTLDACGNVLTEHTLVTADAGYYSHDNLLALHERRIDALIADNNLRKRDPRLAGQDKHRRRKDPHHNKRKVTPKAPRGFTVEQFTYDPQQRTLTCPAGQQLYRNGQHCLIKGRPGMHFRGAKRDCVPCPLREQCLRTPDRTQTRQVTLFLDKHTSLPQRLAQDMRERIDSDQGRRHYAQRFQTVEPVFGNLHYNKGLDRFTLRGQAKVNGQWLLCCLVHNIEKLAPFIRAA